MLVINPEFHYGYGIREYPLCVVNPEKVRIQNRLYDARNPGDLIHVSLCKVPVQPIGYVQSPVET